MRARRCALAGALALRNNAKFRVLRRERASSNPYRIIGLFDHSFSRVVIKGELRKTQFERNLLRLARLQRYPLKSFQTAHRLLEAGAQVAHIALHDFGARRDSRCCEPSPKRSQDLALRCDWLLRYGTDPRETATSDHTQTACSSARTQTETAHRSEHRCTARKSANRNPAAASDQARLAAAR